MEIKNYKQMLFVFYVCFPSNIFYFEINSTLLLATIYAFNWMNHCFTIIIYIFSTITNVLIIHNLLNNYHLPHDRVNNLHRPISKNAIHLTEYHQSVILYMPHQDHWCAVNDIRVIISDDVTIVGAWMSSCGTVFVEKLFGNCRLCSLESKCCWIFWRK